MKIEPVADKAVLSTTVQQAYGIVIQDWHFVPTDWLAFCYAVDCSNGDRYFLKLHDTSVQPAFAASSYDFYLPLTYQLHAKRILPHIPHPITTKDGQLSTQIGDYLLVLHNFIKGTVVGHDGLTDEILAQLAALLGRLHWSTPEINVPRPLIEDFDIVFEGALMSSFELMASVASGSSKGKLRLRDLLSAEKKVILHHLHRLKELQRIVKDTHKEMVICHTDLHGENLMVDDRGNLYILDWENAMIAPPEHDLFFFAGYDSFWSVFLPNYARGHGPVRLNGNVFGFYYYRRGLEDLVDWILRILRGDGDEMRDQADLKEILDCLTGLSFVEKTLAEIRKNLANIPRPLQISK